MTNGLLIQGGNDAAVHFLNSANQYHGEAALAYLHPPFYTDGWAHESSAAHRAAWLDMMRTHLRLVRDLLAPDGSVWVFLNDDRLADCRVLLDKLFGRSNFVATVIVQRPYGPRDSRYLAVNHDYLLVFAKNASIWSPNRIARTNGPDSRYRNPDNDPRGLWRADGLYRRSMHKVTQLQYEVTSPNGTAVMPHADDNWIFSRQRFEELDRDGRIWWREGFKPHLKRFYSEVPDPIPLTVWETTNVGSVRDARQHLRKLLPSGPEHPAPEPEQLLHRVITVSSKPGDLVIDCFGRAGTATAAAHKMGRRWITIADESYDIRPRLDKVILGEDSGGITELVRWSGGGSYEPITAAAPPAEETEETISISEAIADGLVPMPVYSYREDGNTKLETRLADACVLREGTEAEWSGVTKPRLFVLCEKPSEIDEVTAILRRDDLSGAGRVVRAVDCSDDPEVRAVVGHVEDVSDVANITVIAAYHSLSPTTLGRLLSLMSGVNQVDLVVHDAYANLLANRDQIFELRIPTRSLRAPRPSRANRGRSVASIQFPLRLRAAQDERFSLSHIDDRDARTAGATVRHDFPVPLVRQEIFAERTATGDIARGTRPLEPRVAVERLIPVAGVRKAVTTAAHRLVDYSPDEVNGAKRIAKQFLIGAGITTGDGTWSERRKKLAITAMTKLVTDVRKSRQPGSQREWQVITLPSRRRARGQPRKTRNNWDDRFSNAVLYDGWTKSLEPAVRFDAKTTEFRIARLCEDSPSVTRWLGLAGQEAFIEMENGARYFPDFVVVDVDDVHWLVEAKADRDVHRQEVQTRRAAAEEWATFVRDHGEFGVWRYLFVTESMIQHSLTWDEVVARAQPLH